MSAYRSLDHCQSVRVSRILSCDIIGQQPLPGAEVCIASARFRATGTSSSSLAVWWSCGRNRLTGVPGPTERQVCGERAMVRRGTVPEIYRKYAICFVNQSSPVQSAEKLRSGLIQNPLNLNLTPVKILPNHYKYFLFRS